MTNVGSMPAQWWPLPNQYWHKKSCFIPLFAKTVCHFETSIGPEKVFYTILSKWRGAKKKSIGPEKIVYGAATKPVLAQ